MPGAEKDTPARFELGQKLYFDTKLSVNQRQSCNTCHLVDQNRASVDNDPTSEGAHGKRGDRNAPTTLNAGFHFAQFWDGRARDLVEQAKGPVLNPVEMAMPDEKEVVRHLEVNPAYPRLFTAAFPAESPQRQSLWTVNRCGAVTPVADPQVLALDHSDVTVRASALRFATKLTRPPNPRVHSRYRPLNPSVDLTNRAT